MLYAGRLLVGATSGAACVATPIFVCEMSQPNIRGALSTYFEILLCIGILVVYVFGMLVSVRPISYSPSSPAGATRRVDTATAPAPSRA